MTNHYVVEICPQGEIHYYWEDVMAGSSKEAVTIIKKRKPNCDVQQVALTLNDWNEEVV